MMPKVYCPPPTHTHNNNNNNNNNSPKFLDPRVPQQANKKTGLHWSFRAGTTRDGFEPTFVELEPNRPFKSQTRVESNYLTSYKYGT